MSIGARIIIRVEVISLCNATWYYRAEHEGIKLITSAVLYVRIARAKLPSLPGEGSPV